MLLTGPVPAPVSLTDPLSFSLLLTGQILFQMLLIGPIPSPRCSSTYQALFSPRMFLSSPVSFSALFTALGPSSLLLTGSVSSPLLLCCSHASLLPRLVPDPGPFLASASAYDSVLNPVPWFCATWLFRCVLFCLSSCFRLLSAQHVPPRSPSHEGLFSPK